MVDKHGVGSTLTSKRLFLYNWLSVLIGEMAEGPAGEQHGWSMPFMDTKQGLLIQHKQPATSKGSRGISSPGSSGEASLSLAATATPASGGVKKPDYYSENGYLMELSRQERRRIQQEINKRFKPGEVGRLCQTECRSCICVIVHSSPQRVSGQD